MSLNLSKHGAVDNHHRTQTISLAIGLTQVRYGHSVWTRTYRGESNKLCETSDPTFNGFHFEGVPGMTLRPMSHRIVRADPTFSMVGASAIVLFTAFERCIRKPLSVENVIYRGGTNQRIPLDSYPYELKIEMDIASDLFFTKCCFMQRVRIVMRDTARLDLANVTFSNGLYIFICSAAVNELRFDGVIGKIRIFDFVDSAIRAQGPLIVHWCGFVRRLGVRRCPPTIEVRLI